MKSVHGRRRALARLVPGMAFLMAAIGWMPARAATESPNQRVVIRTFRGPEAARVKDAVESALLLRYALVPDSMVIEAARQSGGRLLTDQDFAAVGKTLNVQAFVSATVHRQQDWRVEMVVRKGDTGQTVARYDWTGRRIDALASSIARRTPQRLRVLLAGRADLEPAGVVETVRAPATTPPASDGVSSGGGPVAAGDRLSESASDRASDRPFLEISLGGRAFTRSMSFNQNVNGLPGYHLDRGTGLTAEMALHPFSMSGATAKTWAAGIGLLGTVTTAFGVATNVDATGIPVQTAVYGYEVGIRYRIAAGRLDLLPRGSYLVDKFVTDGNASPNVHYQVVRAGVGARVALSTRVSLRASMDYLQVLSAGALTQTMFPRASANGVDIALGAGCDIGNAFEAQLSGGLRRYGFDMRSKPGDAFVAGGASDQYLSLVLGMAYRPSLGRY